MKFLDFLYIFSAIAGIVFLIFSLLKEKTVKKRVIYFSIFIFCVVLSIFIYKISNRPLISLSSEEINKIHSQSFYYSGKFRSDSGPVACSTYRKELEELANKLYSDPRYESQAPKETSLIYRLYAASILFTRPSSESTEDLINIIKDSLPWLLKAIKLNHDYKDYIQLKNAETFFNDIVNMKYPNVKYKTLLTHMFRIAMPDANSVDVDRQVQNVEEITKKMMLSKNDYEYLRDYRVGNFTVGKSMEAMRIYLKGKFPEIDIGGQPIFFPLSNGNTKVSYTFSSSTKKLCYEWEVNEAKTLIIPLNEATKELMGMKKKKPIGSALEKPSNLRSQEAKDWQKHIHPHGFTFKFPPHWSVTDDYKNNSTLLCPPGVTLKSPGAKIICLVTAHHGISDPFAMRLYYEKQFSAARIINYAEESFTKGNRQGAILTWDIIMPRSKVKSGLQAIVVIIKNWAISIEAYGPRAQREVHQATIQRIAESLAWE